MKNRQTLSAVFLTMVIVGLAYLSFRHGPEEASIESPAGPLGQASTAEAAEAATLARLAKPVALPATAPETANAEAGEERYPHRLRNTKEPIGELVRNEKAVLLRNALIDTALGTELDIPDSLRAGADPKTYIAQARGPVTAAFRRHITSAGGRIVSYIPNNAYLVRLDSGGADRLAKWPGTQSVLPFEPYYKLEMKLLEMAVAGQALPDDALLNVVLFPGSEPTVAKRLAKLGVEVLTQDRTPFGAKLVARVPSHQLSALSRLTEVQGLERYRPRRLANDLTRPRLGVEVFKAQTAADGTVTNVLREDYLGLNGLGIHVNVNDSGVDDKHPAFGKRVKGPGAGSDPEGHGTFVAGVIAGDGSGSDSITANPPPGSFKDPDFKGMAPKARLHVLKADDDKVNNPVSDDWLQTEAATANYDRKTSVNVLISNNSWEYEDQNDYTWAAASYDAATRDALPERAGDQQVIYVFPAGNSGAGTDNGLNASPGTISAPGTAKNVITVGAIETGRNIEGEAITSVTNTVTEIDEDGEEVEKEVITTTTNTPFAGMTDSNNQVAAFSSRGNVGIGIEGTYGRFKPDLVAPGTFLISTRSGDWKNDITSTNAQADADAVEKLNDELGNQYRYESGTSVAAPAISGMLALMQEFYTKRLKRTNSPAMLKALLINSAQSVDRRYNHDVNSTVNHQGWGLPDLQRAAPALANANRTLENIWPLRMIDQSLTNALATGQSRSWEITLGDDAMLYPLRFTLAWTDPAGNPNAGVKLVNDLDLIVTPISDSSLGQGPSSGSTQPGNSEMAEDDETEEVFYGNNIGPSVYNSMGATNDVINNVENVFLEQPSAQKYRVTVYARRVNVDALSGFYDAESPKDHVDVVQDFALVMSSGNPDVSNAFKIKTDTSEEIELPPVTTLTNGMPMLGQHVGANSALAKEVDTNHTVYANRRGITNQWHFFTFTNAPPEKNDDDIDTTDPDDGSGDDVDKPDFGQYVAFITFMPPNLSDPRQRDADIDLYVSRDPKLMDLDPDVLDEAFRSTDRGGSEYITFEDAKVGKDEVFYIGVKSEDQMAAEFGLVGLSSSTPFGGLNNDGNLNMMPLPGIIPDGSAADPGGVSIFGIYIGDPQDYVQSVIVISEIYHQEIGDLWGQLSHYRNAVVLNNHTLAEAIPNQPYPTDFVFRYDDELEMPQDYRDENGILQTDGPGSLNDFKWEPAMGVWQLDMVDSAMSFTGIVDNLVLKVEAVKNLGLFGAQGIDVNLKPGESEDFLIDVPFNATNMIVQVKDMTGPIDVYIRKDEEPKIKAEDWEEDLDESQKIYDKSTIDADPDPVGGEWDGSPTRGEIHYGLEEPANRRSPYDPDETERLPLSEGRWFVTTDNPNLNEVDFHIRVIFEYDISLENSIKLVSEEPEPIEDDLVTKSLLTVTNDFLVGMMEVGVRIDHPRIADLDMTLVSPQGTRLLLSENRGHTNIAYGVTQTDVLEGDPIMEDGFEAAENDFIEDSTMFNSGWQLEAGDVYAYASGEVSGWTAHSGDQFIELNGFEPGTISTNVITAVNQFYRLTFAYAKNPDSEDSLEMKVKVGSVIDLKVTASIEGENKSLDWEIKQLEFTATETSTKIEFKSLEEGEYAVLLDTVMVAEVEPANLYATFSELENLARDPMKFNYAPYATKEEQVLFSGFEDALVGYAKLDDEIDGWTVTNEQVRVSQSAKAHSGGYYATLSRNKTAEVDETGGAITRDLPTAVGQDYRLSFVTHAGGDDVEYVLGGVITNAVEGMITLTNSIPASSQWITNKIQFTASRSVTPFTIRTESAAVRLDTIELMGPGPHNLAEESLDILRGERAMGDWVLEVRDHRVGPDDSGVGEKIDPTLVSWYIKIIGSVAEDTEVIDEKKRSYTRDDTADSLDNGKKSRGKIVENETNYWTVETCEESTKLTIELSSIKKRNNAKVSLLANYGGFPTGDASTDDYVKADMNDSYFAKLELDDSGHLPLQPGELLYLTVQKMDTNTTQRAIYDIVAKWNGNCDDEDPPDGAFAERLARAEGSTTFSLAAGGTSRLVWSVPANTPAALLELTGLNVDADVELISANGRHVRNSINPEQAPEQIVLREGDYIPTLEGDWIIEVTNHEAEPGEFTVNTTLATEQGDLVSSQPISLGIESQFWPPKVRLAWPSVPGEQYILETSSNLVDWKPVHQKFAETDAVVFHIVRDFFKNKFFRIKHNLN